MNSAPRRHLFRSHVGAACIVAILTPAAPGARAQIAPGWPPAGHAVANQHTLRGFPAEVPDGLGGCFVVWQEDAMIRVQHFEADGAVAAGWSVVAGLRVCDEPVLGGYMQSSPQAISDDAGGFYVLWHDERNTHCGLSCLDDPKQIFVQRITADGTIASGWPALGIPAGSEPSSMSPAPHGLYGFAGDLNTTMVPMDAGAR